MSSFLDVTGRPLPIHGAKQSVNAYKLYTYHRKKSNKIHRNICEFPHLPTA